MDPWEILQIPRTADARTAKLAYLHIARQYHPDKGGDPRLFKTLQRAYADIQNHLRSGSGGSDGGSGDASHNDLKNGFGSFDYSTVKYAHRLDPHRYDPHSFNKAYNRAHNISEEPDPLEERTLADLERENAAIERQLGNIGRIFRGGRFDARAFNKLFEHYQQSHRQRTGQGLEEVGAGDPQPMMAAGNMAFSSVGDPSQSANLTSLGSAKVDRVWRGAHDNPNRVDPRLRRRMMGSGLKTSVRKEKKADRAELQERMNEYKREGRLLQAQIRNDMDPMEDSLEEDDQEFSDENEISTYANPSTMSPAETRYWGRSHQQQRTGRPLRADPRHGGELVLFGSTTEPQSSPPTALKRRRRVGENRRKHPRNKPYWPTSTYATEPNVNYQNYSNQDEPHSQYPEYPEYQQGQYPQHQQYPQQQYPQQQYPQQQYPQQQYPQQQYPQQQYPQQQYPQQYPQQQYPQQQYPHQYPQQQYQQYPQQQYPEQLYPHQQYPPQQYPQQQYPPQQYPQQQYSAQYPQQQYPEQMMSGQASDTYPIYPGAPVNNGGFGSNARANQALITPSLQDQNRRYHEENQYARERRDQYDLSESEESESGEAFLSEGEDEAEDVDIRIRARTPEAEKSARVEVQTLRTKLSEMEKRMLVQDRLLQKMMGSKT